MQTFLKSRLHRWFIILMITFMLISTLISYVISRNLMMDMIESSNESELLLSLDTIQDQINESLENFLFYVDDAKLFSYYEKMVADGTLLQYAADVNSDNRTFLYANREFSGFFVFQNRVMVGTNFSFETVSNTEDISEAVRTNTIQHFFLEEIRKLGLYDRGELVLDNIIVAPAEDQVYYVAVINLEELMQSNHLRLLKLNSRDEVVFGADQITPGIVEQLGDEHVEPGIVITRKIGNEIVSFIKGVNHERYAVKRSMDEMNGSFARIVWRLVAVGLVLLIVFSFASRLLARRLLSPIHDFIDNLKNVRGVTDHDSIRGYITRYEGHTSFYTKIFKYFTLVGIPVSCMVLLSFFYFEAMIETNTRQTHLEIFEKTATGMNNHLQSYRSYLRYLSLDREFQDLMLQVNALDGHAETNVAFSNILVKKGAINKSLNYISIYNARNELVFSNAINHTAESPAEHPFVFKEMELVKNQDAQDPVVIMRNEVKYLSKTTDKSKIFHYMGYIEIGIKHMFDHNPTITKDSTYTLSVIDSEDQIYMVGASIENQYLRYLSSNLRTIDTDLNPYTYIQLNGEKTLFSLFPIYTGKWKLGFFTSASWEKHKYIFVLLYVLEFICMLAIIIGVSNWLGRRTAASTRRAIRIMERYPDDPTLRLHGDESDFEFAILAKKFNQMLSRLEMLSAENLQLDKRINKLLLRALQAQINPHFLQNIFTSIMLLLKTGKSERASEMLVGTAHFLKSGLDGTRDLVFLQEELDHVKHYIQIQSIRFEKQLQCMIDVEKSHAKSKVPKFILQPLIENSIHHAMKKNELLTIRIYSSIEQAGSLLLVIEDDGAGMDEAALSRATANMHSRTAQTEHYGLSNVHERICLEFGEVYGLSLESSPQTGTRVKVRLPTLIEE